MGHQVHVVTVIAAEVLEAVGKALPAREMLLEHREAAAHRVAPRVDDLCVRQDQVDQADVLPVVRHLVDEERSAGPSLDPGLLEITFAELAQLVRTEPGEDLRVGRGVALALAAAQATGDRAMSGNSIVPSTAE